MLFHAMEETATTDTKRICADRIKSIAAKSISQTIVESPQWFIEAFDRIFGDRHLTWRCFLRSCVASMVSVVVMTIVWVFLDPISWQKFLSYNGEGAIGMILVFAFVLNLVPDYISLLETRWVLRIITHTDIKELIVLLVLDVLITGGIFFCGVVVVILIYCVSSGDWRTLAELPEIFLILFILFQWAYVVPFGIFFYSTYFTSVWLYLFIAASIATKLLYSLGTTGNQVLALLKVEEKPFNSMGLLLIGLLTLAFAIYAIIGAIV